MEDCKKKVSGELDITIDIAKTTHLAELLSLKHNEQYLVFVPLILVL